MPQPTMTPNCWIADGGDEQFEITRDHVLDKSAVERDAERGGAGAERVSGLRDAGIVLEGEPDQPGGGAMRDRRRNPLEHDRIADLARGTHRLLGGTGEAALCDWKACGLKDARREILRDDLLAGAIDEIAPAERHHEVGTVADAMTQVRRMAGDVPGGADHARVLLEHHDALLGEALRDAGRGRQPAEADRLVGAVAQILEHGGDLRRERAEPRAEEQPDVDIRRFGDGLQHLRQHRAIVRIGHRTGRQVDRIQRRAECGKDRLEALACRGIERRHLEASARALIGARARRCRRRTW